MLTLITGHVQSGKTTKLLSLCDNFEREGRSIFGVISPSIFDNDGKKVGVKAKLLPKQVIFDVGLKSDEGWNFDEKAIAKVNTHFAFLSSVPDVFVVDEIGPLELNFGSGFSVALEMLKVGSDVCGDNAFVVVRQKLKDPLLKSIEEAWDEIELIEI